MNLLRKSAYSLLSALMLLSSISVSVHAAQPRMSTSEEENVNVDIISENARSASFNSDWKFNLGDVNASAVDFNDNSWRKLDLPHDYSIEQAFTVEGEAESGFLLGGVGWYRKNFVVPERYNNKTIVINFDGVYMNAEVYLNGKKLGTHPYGYTAFAFDLSDDLICDGKKDNVIAVRVNNKVPSSRWYSGSGIYRDVTITVTDKVHIARNGIAVTTPNLEKEKDGDVQVSLETTIDNDNTEAKDITVRNTIYDKDGKAVSNAVENNINVVDKASETITQTAAVNQPTLWSVDHPEQYSLKTEVLAEGNVIDSYTTLFGFRYYNFDRDTGFSLNGDNLKLLGMCMHHDQGALGAVANERAIERQMQKLKEMGCNSIRVSHNPAAKTLLDICDRMGIMVIDEAFDGWALPKNGNANDFSAHFNEQISADNEIIDGVAGQTWAEFDAKAMVKNAKNNPSIIMWSITNEVGEGSGTTEEYPTYARNIIKWIQSEDSTRPVTLGDNNAKNGNQMYRQISTIVAEAGGVVGLNYSNQRNNHYKTLLDNNPTWKIYGAETSSAIKSRGVYYTKGRDNETLQMSAYDKNAVGWGQTAQVSWKDVITRDYVAGEYVWTGFDYIGEPTPWNGIDPGSISRKGPAPNSTFFGLLDTAGFEKDSFYFYQSQWRKDITTLHVLPTWDSSNLVKDASGNVEVNVYSNAPKVELFLNGKSLGVKTMTKQTTPQGHSYYANANGDLSLSWNVKYEEGTLSAKAYDENNNEIKVTSGRNAVTTSKAANQLSVSADRNEITADGKDLSYISVDVNDANGVNVSDAANLIDFEISGNGKIVGVDNGNAADTDSYKGTSRKAFSGKALVIVQSTQEEGSFTLTAKSNGLTSDSVTVQTKRSQASGDPYMKSYKMSRHIYVELGEAPTLPNSVEAMFSNGDVKSYDVQWDAYDETLLNTPNTFKINGTLKGTDIYASISIHVIGNIAAIKNYAAFTYAGKPIQLPSTMPGITYDGQEYEKFNVTWDTSTIDWYTPGIYTVKGTASVVNDTMPVTASIRVAKELEDAKNIALNTNKDAPKLSESCDPVSDNLASINNGITNNSVDTFERWTNWNVRGKHEMAYITMEWANQYDINKVDLYLFTDNAYGRLPAEVTFEYWNGSEYVNIPYSNTTPVSYLSGETTYSFTNPVTTSKLRIGMKAVDATKCIGLAEAKVYNYVAIEEAYTSADLESITLDGTPLEGFQADTLNYTVRRNGGYPDVQAVSSQHAAITIVPASNYKTSIIVASEDGKTTKTYTITYESDVNTDSFMEQLDKADNILKHADDYVKNDEWNSFMAIHQEAISFLSTLPTQEEVDEMTAKLADAIANLSLLSGTVQKDALEAEIKKAKGLKESVYTPESWAVLKEVLSEAESVFINENATQAQVNAATDELRSAIAQLKENTTFTKTLLKNAIDKANAAEASGQLKYLAPSVKKMILDARDAAVKVYDDENATIAQVMEAWMNLADAMHYMNFVANKEALQTLVDTNKDLDMNDYKEGVEAFNTALANAKAVLADDKALQARIDEAYKQLYDAVQGLVEKDKVSKEYLEMIVTSIKEHVGDGSKYKKDANWDTFVNALEAAENVLADDNATQEDVEQAFSALTSAYEDIRLEPTEDQLDELNSFVDKAGSINRSLYTNAQLKQIDTLVAEAKNMLKDFDSEKYGSLLKGMEDTAKLIDKVENKTPNKPANPSKPSVSDNTGNQNKPSAKPATGDSTDSYTPLIIFAISGVIIVAAGVIWFLRKKKKQK